MYFAIGRETSERNLHKRQGIKQFFPCNRFVKAGSHSQLGWILLPWPDHGHGSLLLTVSVWALSQVIWLNLQKKVLYFFPVCLVQGWSQVDSPERNYLFREQRQFFFNRKKYWAGIICHVKWLSVWVLLSLQMRCRIWSASFMAATLLVYMWSCL